MKFYVTGGNVDDLKNFFSTLPEDQRPKIVSDKENPNVWDHVSDSPLIIATEEPRLDTDAVELSIEGRQLDEVMNEITPPGSSDPEAQAEVLDEVGGYRSFADRGFKVGRLS